LDSFSRVVQQNFKRYKTDVQSCTAPSTATKMIKFSLLNILLALVLDTSTSLQPAGTKLSFTTTSNNQVIDFRKVDVVQQPIKLTVRWIDDHDKHRSINLSLRKSQRTYAAYDGYDDDESVRSASKTYRHLI
jgi:hypothetical protein